MRPLLSVMIPSRWRYQKCLAAVKSWIEHTADLDALEILVRLHESDHECEQLKKELESLVKGLVRVTIGPDKPWDPKHPGNRVGNNWLWNQLLPQATGLWHQYWSDDMTIFDNGCHWDECLIYYPNEGLIVQPEIHKLGGSTYGAHEAGPVPFVPAAALPKLKYPELMEPPDTTIHNILSKAGWKTTYLMGVGVHHHRDVDRTLTEQ